MLGGLQPNLAMSLKLSQKFMSVKNTVQLVILKPRHDLHWNVFRPSASPASSLMSSLVQPNEILSRRTVRPKRTGCIFPIEQEIGVYPASSPAESHKEHRLDHPTTWSNELKILEHHIPPHWHQGWKQSSASGRLCQVDPGGPFWRRHTFHEYTCFHNAFKWQNIF